MAPSSGGDATAFGKAPNAAGTVGAKNVAPTLVLRTNPAMNGNNTVSGTAPFTVTFNLCPSSDPDPGDSLNWQFNFGDSGKPPFNSNGTFNPDFDQFCRIDHTYDREGTYTATVSVTDKHLEDQSNGVTSLARKTQTVIVQVSGKQQAASCSALGVSTNFDSFAAATPAGSLNIPGVTFSGTNGQIYNGTPFTTLSGNQLLVNNSGPLTITWASDQSGASFRFAVSSASTVTVQGYSGTGALLFTAPFTGVVQASGFPEGTAAGNAVFRQLVISYTSFALVIDNLSSTPFCQ